MDIGPLSRYYVDMCPLRMYCVDRFCWFLAVSLINYPDMYGLIYQPLSRQNNLSHIFHITKDCLWQLHHVLNAIFTMVGKERGRVIYLEIVYGITLNLNFRNKESSWNKNAFVWRCTEREVLGIIVPGFRYVCIYCDIIVDERTVPSCDFCQ